jgi:hypothetical protein
MPDNLIMGDGGWDTAATTAFFDEVIRQILDEAGAQTETVAHSGPRPVLHSRVGRSTISPVMGTVRAATSHWLDKDSRGSYCAVGNRTRTAVVSVFLGGAGGPPAKQIRAAQAYLVDAWEGTVGLGPL